MKRLIVVLGTSLLLADLAAAAELDYFRQDFQLPAEIERLLLADTNGDDLNELIAVVDKKIRVYFQDSDGFDFENSYAEVEFPGEAVGWDISSSYNDSGNASIIALVNGTEVLSWDFQDQQVLEPRTIASGLPGFLSKGVNRLYFSQDINDDSLEDLVIPGAGTLQLFIAEGNSEYQTAFSIETETRLRTNLNSQRLERRTGQALRIPLMNLRDVNGDGLNDLVSRTDESLDVFIADATAANYFPSSPSYSLDITEIEERLGDFDIDSLDFSNLTGVLALTHEEILEDVDGDGIEDLLLREGGKVSLFGGTSDGMNLEQPRQVLRSGGNVLSTFLYDENEDGLKDLWLWRVESISVGDIFMWLALSGNVSIEAFIYPNEGERFSRRPARRLNVALKFPSVIRLASSFQEISQEVEESEMTRSIPTSLANLDNDASAQDLLVLVNRQLQLFLNSVEPVNDSTPFLGGLGYSRERNDYEIDIREIIDNISIGENSNLSNIDGRTADQAIDLGTDIADGDILAARLNADARDDIFVFTNYDASHIQGMLLLSK